MRRHGMKHRQLLLPLLAALALTACHRPEPARQTAADQARAVSVVRLGQLRLQQGRV